MGRSAGWPLIRTKYASRLPVTSTGSVWLVVPTVTPVRAGWPMVAVDPGSWSTPKFALARRPGVIETTWVSPVVAAISAAMLFSLILSIRCPGLTAGKWYRPCSSVRAYVPSSSATIAPATPGSSGPCRPSRSLSSKTLPMIVPRSKSESTTTETAARSRFEMMHRAHTSLATAVFVCSPGTAPDPITSW